MRLMKKLSKKEREKMIAEVERIAEMVGKKMPKGKSSVDLIREERE
jgi:hypothetical protein